MPVQDVLAMGSNANTDADKLITFGQMALEQGWYDQAHEYFEQALDLDSCSREALAGLLQVSEVLSHRMPTAIEPITTGQPVAPPREIERKRGIPEKKREMRIGSLVHWLRGQPRLRKMIVLAGVQVLLLCLYVGLADIVNPSSKATPTSVSLDMPMPAGAAETLFIESNEEQTLRELVNAQGSGIGDEETFAEMAEQLETIIDAVSVIETDLPKPTAVSEVEGGWLCDWDGRGEVALWSKPAMAFQEGNATVAVVEMSVKGCVDAILLDETASGDTVFYETSVGDDQGWVGADYFYPISIGKPDWSQ